MPKKLAKLEHALGHRFGRLELLERALTHRSWAHESLPDGSDAEVRALQNESFEFVGDAVLGLAISEALYLKHPKASEGDLTLMKHQLVSTETLGRLAVQIELGSYMRVGRGEEKTGGRRKLALLADTFEAVIASIFFDAGYIAARNFVERVFIDEIRRATPQTALDYKTLLQETLQSNKHPAPTYKLVSTEGPPHERMFHVEVTWETGAATATGSTIKQAEMHAAAAALEEIAAAAGGQKS